VAERDGYGNLPYGGGPHGGAYVEGEDAVFDLFCIADEDMFEISLNPLVTLVGSGTQFNPNAVTWDMEVCSGGSFLADNAQIIVTHNIPDKFTAEWIVNFDNLPNDFTDLPNSHIYFSVTDAAGPLLGFFFSKVGVAYTGDVSFPAGLLQLNCTFQQLPDSDEYVSEGEYWIIRAAVDLSLDVVYFYMTKQSEYATLGHQLRAILPAIPYTASAGSPTDRGFISIRGSATTQSCAFLDKFCVGTALIIPNLAPVANSGDDQAARSCDIIQLDGSGSFDPEGAPLGYQWRLLEGPSDSEFVEQLHDGFTLGDPTGTVDKFYSTALGAIHAGPDPIITGDVINLDAVGYTIIGTGIDGSGFYIQIAADLFPELLSAKTFKFLRQRGISQPTTERPTYFPDVAGFYTFGLIVDDGNLSSSESTTIVNVLESPLPRGCTPDLRFLFNYLSDFWRLVEDKDRIAVFWGSLAQAAATELLSLWQHEYSKSLRDIQRTFNRRWLHYDLLLPEPLPELTRTRVLFGGIESGYFFVDGRRDVGGTDLVISSPVLAADYTLPISLSNPVTHTALAAWLQDRLQELVDSRFTTQALSHRTPIAATGTITCLAKDDYTDGETFVVDDGFNTPVTFEIWKTGVFTGPNEPVDIRFILGTTNIGATVAGTIDAAAGLDISAVYSGGGVVSLTNDRPGEPGNQPITLVGGINMTSEGMDGGSGGEYIRIDAPFPFTIGDGTTAPFTEGDEGRSPSGVGGSGIGTRTYKVGISLEGLDIQEDDFLSVDGVAYRISSVVDNVSDTFSFQRLVVKEDLPTAPLGEWDLSGWVSSELLNFYDGLVSAGDYADFEVSESTTDADSTEGTSALVETEVFGASAFFPGRIAVDFWNVGQYIADSTLQVFLARVLRNTWIPRDELVVDVPTLQEKIVIEDDEETLRRNVDYFLEELRGRAGIRFSSGQTAGDLGDIWEGARPPSRMWAEYSYINNNPLIEANFGIAAEFTLDQLDELPESVDYLSAVRGIWYAIYNGPAIRNLRVGVQILLGLPFAEETGTIEELRTDFSPTNGRILIRDVANTEIVRSYSYPKSLNIEENPDTGATYVVGDTVTQFSPLVEGAEVIDYLKDEDWFEGILNQGIFYEVEKFHKFLVRVDTAAFNLSALLFAQNFIQKVKPTYTYPLFFVKYAAEDGLGTEVSVTDDVTNKVKLILTDTPGCGMLGASWHYDDPQPAGGGWRSQYDADPDRSTVPVFPTPETVTWGFDKTYICPEDDIVGVWCEQIAGAFTVFFDGPFAYDTPGVQERMYFFNVGAVNIPAGSTGKVLTAGSDPVADFTGDAVQIRFIAFGDPNSGNLRGATLFDEDDGVTTNVYTDYIFEALSPATGDVPLLPTAGEIQIGDCFYIGLDAPYNRVLVDILTAGVGSWVLEYQYWNGSAYTPLAGVGDGTNGFKTAGLNIIHFTRPTDWVATRAAPTGEGGSPGDWYYIRAVVTTPDAAPTTRPVASQILPQGDDYEVVVENATQATEVAEAFTSAVNTEIVRTISLPVTAGDQIFFRVRAASGTWNRIPNWSSLAAYVTIEEGTIWQFGESLGNGEYCLERTL
jgi:hypothetical protein